jgi:hypothetical protein
MKSITYRLLSGGLISFLAFSLLAVGHERKAAVLPALQQACAPLPSGLVSWWPAEGNANDIQDGNNGTLINGVSFAPGEVGQAFSFIGTDYVDIPDASNLDFGLNSPISIDMWVFRTSNAPVMHFIGKRSGCGTISYQMALDSSGLGFSGELGGVSSHQDLPLNTWTHLAGTFDGTTYRFYINGTLAGTPTTGTLGPTTTAPLRIGTSGTCAGFGGLIDEVHLFNRALTQAEIQTIVNAGAAGTCACSVPVVTLNPATQVGSGGSVTLTASASGSPAPTVQWQVSTDGGATFTNIPGATSTTLSFTPTPSQTGSKYRAVFTNVCGNAATTAATLTVLDVCLRDSSTGNLLQWNSVTGQYKFTRCSDGFMLTGTGSVGLVNGIRTLTDFKTDRRLSAGFNTSQLNGNATIYLQVAQGVWQVFRISETIPTPCLCRLN